MLKDQFRRSESANAEILSSRVNEGSSAVPVEHVKDFIQHSINESPKCLHKEHL